MILPLLIVVIMLKCLLYLLPLKWQPLQSHSPLPLEDLKYTHARLDPPWRSDAVSLGQGLGLGIFNGILGDYVQGILDAG